MNMKYSPPLLYLLALLASETAFSQVTYDSRSGVSGSPAGAWYEVDGNTHADNTSVTLGTQWYTTDTVTGAFGWELVTTTPVQIKNVGAGEVSSTSKDAVNGSQLDATQTQVNTVQNQVGNVQNQVSAVKSQVGTMQAHINTVQNQVGAVQTQVNTVQNQVAQVDARVDTVQQQVNVQQDSINNHEGRITQLENQSADHTQKLNGLIHKMGKLDSKISKGLASNAALGGLFQPYTIGKVNLTAGVGGFEGHQAVAIGAGYRFNETFAAKVGVASSGQSNTTYNAAINFEW